MSLIIELSPVISGEAPTPPLRADSERFTMMTSELAEKEEISLGPLSQIPVGEGRQFHVAGQDVSVFRLRSGKVYATQALCPHREGPLADGLLGGTTLACPLHSWKFNLETGDPIQGDCGITTYPVRVGDEGEIIMTVE